MLPFVRVARGNKSNLTYLVALKLADLVVTRRAASVYIVEVIVKLEFKD